MKPLLFTLRLYTRVIKNGTLSEHYALTMALLRSISAFKIGNIGQGYCGIAESAKVRLKSTTLLELGLGVIVSKEGGSHLKP